MFEDFEDESIDVTPDSPDRAIVWAIYARGDAGGLTPEEAWAILHERYPDDPRFLLLNAYAELGESRKQSDAPKAEEGVWTPAYFLTKVQRVLGGAPVELHPQIRDLLVFGGAILAGAKGDDARMLADLRVKIDAAGEPEPKRDERDRAGLRLRRFEREVVKELHDRTQDGKPLGVRAPTIAPPASPANDWAAAVADKGKPRRKYSATERFARGELVEHPKFGVGVVTGTEPGKAVILFESGIRKLVAGA
ncbi:MAG TPA: hypothetical protein VM925_29740 [Labilithrix sp.]|nr:hypothetical protein [Labilithrix sp.]